MQYPRVDRVFFAAREGGARSGLDAVVRALAAHQIQAGYLGEPGDAALHACPLPISRIVDAFDDDALSPWRRTLEQLPAAAQMLVSEHAGPRVAALAGGWRVCPSVRLAVDAALGERLSYVRITASAEALVWLRGAEGISAHHHEEDCIYATVSERGLAAAGAAGLELTQVGPAGLPDTTTLHRVRIGAADPSILPAGLVLGRTSDAVIVALPIDLSLADFHVPSAGHGHGMRLFVRQALHHGPPAPPAAPRSALTPADLAALRRIAPQTIAADNRRYSGEDEVTPGIRLRSRDVGHADNSRAVDQLADDLLRIGGGRLKIDKEPFETDAGNLYTNVIADLPGSTDVLVVIGAHLDSTSIGDRAPGEIHVHTTAPAPGANDDASGIAAVLAIAEVLAAHAGPLRRTIRFALFNAEERFMAGSADHVKRLTGDNVAVAGMFQMDMIGRAVDQPPDWEIHAGTLAHGSQVLSDLLQAAAAQLADPLAAPTEFSETDDYAAHVSDHAPFAAEGYPAVLISERDLPRRPNDPNADPHYHRSSDRTIDADYTAYIARIVAGAALMLARG